MFDTEAARLCEILLEQEILSPLLNLGSSTREFRHVTKPHIEARLFKPLVLAGVTVVHSDLKAAEGVDISGDILDPAVLSRLKAMGVKCVLISNLLEHVRDRPAAIAACEEIVGSGGLILATVPSSFPFHADPIDTYYRPTPDALARAFTGSEILLSEELIGRTYAEQIEAAGSALWRELALTICWSLIFFLRPKSAASRLHRWLWYKRNYRVSIALVAVR